jgi:dihydrofolate reductase
MLHNQKIIFVTITDNQSQMIANLGTRIWHHEILIREFLKTENCLIGRVTYDLTRWRGENLWVITRDRKWRRMGIGTIHDIDDLHLHTEGPLYVLGGKSIFKQFEKYVDEIHLYVLNNKEGSEEWIKLTMAEWKPFNYRNENIWSYAHLIRKEKPTPEPYDVDSYLFD